MRLSFGFISASDLDLSRRFMSGFAKLGQERRLFADLSRTLLVVCGPSPAESLHELRRTKNEPSHLGAPLYLPRYTYIIQDGNAQESHQYCSNDCDHSDDSHDDRDDHEDESHED